MRILLDTECWLWTLAASERFSPREQELVRRGQNVLLLSAVSTCEITIKVRLG